MTGTPCFNIVKAPLLSFWIVYMHILAKLYAKSISARPEVRGTADVGWRSLFPLPFVESSSYSLTTISSHVSTDRRAVTDMNGLHRRGRWLRTIFGRLRRRECCMLEAPSSQPTVPLHELPPARLLIHRQTSAHERRKWTRSVQSRSGIFAYLCTRQHWL